MSFSKLHLLTKTVSFKFSLDVLEQLEARRFNMLREMVDKAILSYEFK